MARGIDGKTTNYEITFPVGAYHALRRLSHVLEGLLPEADIEVHGHGSICSITVEIAEDMDDGEAPDAP